MPTAVCLEEAEALAKEEELAEISDALRQRGELPTLRWCGMQIPRGQRRVMPWLRRGSPERD
jgi:hypothetical protein